MQKCKCPECQKMFLAEIAEPKVHPKVNDTFLLFCKNCIEAYYGLFFYKNVKHRSESSLWLDEGIG